MKPYRFENLEFVATPRGLEVNRDLSRYESEMIARIPWHVVEKLAALKPSSGEDA